MACLPTFMIFEMDRKKVRNVLKTQVKNTNKKKKLECYTTCLDNQSVKRITTTE